MTIAASSTSSQTLEFFDNIEPVILIQIFIWIHQMKKTRGLQ